MTVFFSLSALEDDTPLSSDLSKKSAPVVTFVQISSLYNVSFFSDCLGDFVLAFSFQTFEHNMPSGFVFFYLMVSELPRSVISCLWLDLKLSCHRFFCLLVLLFAVLESNCTYVGLPDIAQWYAGCCVTTGSGGEKKP